MTVRGGQRAQSGPSAVRQRRDRLARSTAAQAEAALAYLSLIGPLMFTIVMDAADLIAGVPPRDEPADEDEEAVPVCRRCGAQAGIFPDQGLHWQHFRGDWTTAGTQETYDPGHPPEITWRLPAKP
jgi:hypothetical protein